MRIGFFLLRAKNFIDSFYLFFCHICFHSVFPFSFFPSLLFFFFSSYLYLLIALPGRSEKKNISAVKYFAPAPPLPSPPLPSPSPSPSPLLMIRVSSGGGNYFRFPLASTH